MKKSVIFVLIVLQLILVSGCTNNKNIYLPEAENDKIYVTIP